MLARAARQLVWRYLSWNQETQIAQDSLENFIGMTWFCMLWYGSIHEALYIMMLGVEQIICWTVASFKLVRGGGGGNYLTLTCAMLTTTGAKPILGPNCMMPHIWYYTILTKSGLSPCVDYYFNQVLTKLKRCLTLIRVMLYCMVRITTRINSPPKDISDIGLSLNHGIFFNVCNREWFSFHIFSLFFISLRPTCSLLIESQLLCTYFSFQVFMNSCQGSIYIFHEQLQWHSFKNWTALVTL